jgi:mutator protein MutT
MKDVLHDCAMAILRAGDSVLMCHRHPAREWIPDVWDFPGGHVEPDETPQQALVRELDEELGVTIDAPTAAPDDVLNFEEESVRLSVWFIDYSDQRAGGQGRIVRSFAASASSGSGALAV